MVMVKLLISVSFFLFSVSMCSAQYQDTIIKNIRQLFRAINNDRSLHKVELKNDEFLKEETLDGGCSLTGYFKKDTIYKMAVWIGLSFGIRQYEYYFRNEQLFFIYETEDDFFINSSGEMDQTKLKRGFEGRYYLVGRRVLEIKNHGEKRFEEKPSKHYVGDLIADSKSYVKLLQIRLKKGK
jgi:hypothetical protein